MQGVPTRGRCADAPVALDRVGQPTSEPVLQAPSPSSTSAQPVTVTLATGIPRGVVESLHLRHLDPAAVDVAAYEADPGTFVVPHAGEVLHRLRLR